MARTFPGAVREGEKVKISLWDGKLGEEKVHLIRHISCCSCSLIRSRMNKLAIKKEINLQSKIERKAAFGKWEVGSEKEKILTKSQRWMQ